VSHDWHSAGFGVAVCLVFDWCWYPELPPHSSKPHRDYMAGVRRFLIEAGIDDRVQPQNFVWLSVGLGTVSGVFAYQVLQLAVIALAVAVGLGLLPVLVGGWLRARRRARIQHSVGDVL